MARPKPLDASLMASPDDTEHQFYEALQRGDIDRLMSVWSDDDDITCVHPGGPRLFGAADIRSAFETLFANGPVNAHPEKLRCMLTQSCAIHSVLERIQLVTAEGTQSAWVIATNVYVKTTQGWRLASHHASPGTLRETSELRDLPSVLH